jgi:hypothetical protein
MPCTGFIHEAVSKRNKILAESDSMSTPMYKKCLLAMIPFLFVILLVGLALSAGRGVLETINNATIPFDAKEHIDSVPPVPDNTVPVKTSHLGQIFRTETRKDKIERFKCSQCHNNKEVKITRAAEMAHGTVVVVHGGEGNPLACFTCHNEDERDFLVTEKGLRVDMDHSYQMCGQCHFRERRDWVGGAHGKRVSYWAGERVVKNCTSCHDPHSPLFEKRWPKTYSPPFK